MYTYIHICIHTYIRVYNFTYIPIYHVHFSLTRSLGGALAPLSALQLLRLLMPYILAYIYTYIHVYPYTLSINM